MRTKREQAVEKEINALESGSLKAVSQLQTQVNLIKVLLPWMHNNIVNSLGDVSEANRADLASTLDPALIDVITMISDLQSVAAIYNDDPATYATNTANYIALNPTVLSEAELRF